MELESPTEQSSRPKIFWPMTKFIINILVLIIILSTGNYICKVPFEKYHYLFTWHVVLGSVAYVIIIPISLIIFDDSFLLSKVSRKRKSWLHGTLLVIATIFVAVCIILDYKRKEIYEIQYGFKHFDSPHSITGLISLIFLIIGNIFGVIIAKKSWFGKYIASVRPIVLKLIHNIIGQLSFAIGVISLCIILNGPWFIYYASTTAGIILTVLILITTVFSLINSFISEYNQIKSLR